MDELLTKTIGIGENDFLGEGEDRSVPLVPCYGKLEVDDRLSRGRVKIAASEAAIAEAMKVRPVPGRVYTLVIGLGSEEFWGINNNGDSFPENGLLGLAPKGVSMSFFDKYAKRLPKEWGYKTFKKAHVFEEHRNSNPKLAKGGVHDTFWNDRMHRVENLIWVDRAKAPKWAGRIDKGEPVGTSMACRVPFDRCSVCGNLAPTRAQYCAHLRPGSMQYQLRQIREDGKGVSMINDFPDFFDESLVENPAAPEAMMIMKVASDKSAKKKEADIIKEDADLPLDVAMDDLSTLYHSEPKLPAPVLDRLTGIGLHNAIKAAARLGMCLKPSEVFHIHFGSDFLEEKTASWVDRIALQVAPMEVDVERIKKAAKHPIGTPDSIKIAQAISLLTPYAPMRSYEEPHLTARLLKSAAMQHANLPISAGDIAAISTYHTIYKLASGEYGYGPTQARLAWSARHGG